MSGMNLRRGRVVWLLWLLAGLLLGCAADGGAVTESLPLVAAEPTLAPTVSAATVAGLLEAGEEVVILDVREDWEFAEGHISGARWLPLQQIPRRLDEIPQAVPVILVCRSDNRSGQAYQFLRQQGFENVHNLQGGMLAWVEAGYAIEK